jgi:hypothetical protein
MRTHAIGAAVDINTVPEGELFAFRRRDESYLAMRTTSRNTIAILWPHHLTLPNQTGLFNTAALAEYPMWILSNAVAVPNAGLSQLRDKFEYRQNQGSLILAGERMLATVHYKDGDVAWLDLSTGELVYDLPTEFIWFPEWSVRLADADGRHEVVLATIPYMP